MRSEPFRANEGVGEVGEQEHRHAASEDVIDKHVQYLRLKAVAELDESERQGEKGRPYPENDYVHDHGSLLIACWVTQFIENGLRSNTRRRHRCRSGNGVGRLEFVGRVDPNCIGIRDGANRKDI